MCLCVCVCLCVCACVCVPQCMKACERGSLQQLLQRSSGGVPLEVALRSLQHVSSALCHLHGMGILHRDVRAANVLLAATDPMLFLLADFGVSHRMHTFEDADVDPASPPSEGNGDGVPNAAANAPRRPRAESVEEAVARAADGTVLVGAAGLGPLAWMAPEVWLSPLTPEVGPRATGGDGRGSSSGGGDGGGGGGNVAAAVLATPASDVYMLGGLMFEVLTGGRAPFFWLAGNPALMVARRRSARPVPVPGSSSGAAGLLGLSTVAAAAADGVPLAWRVQAGPGAQPRLEALARIMELCLTTSPEDRPCITQVVWAGAACGVELRVAEPGCGLCGRV